MSSSGPRSELLLLTFASVHGLRLALAAWNSGAPGAATWNVSCSCFASSSLSALAQPYLNCSRLSVTARFQLAGFPSTGEADFNEEIGSGSTPRKGAESIATVAADSPRPAMICASSPPYREGKGRLRTPPASLSLAPGADDDAEVGAEI